MAKRLVGRGHSVEWFSASFPGAARSEEIDGVHFVRRGRQWTVHMHAFKHYFRRVRDQFDVVIDEVNTMPFFTPIWSRVPRLMLIYQLAREVWWYESPFPLSAIGYAAEPFYLRVYRDTPAITISMSTVSDLRRLGFRAPVNIMPVGIEPVSQALIPKASTPTFIYVGRLAPSKRVDHMLYALAEYRRVSRDGRLWLVGTGSANYRERLRRLCVKLGLEDSVVFWGRIGNDQKHRLMSEAHALLMTSIREGWGLVVTEASACGTPAIVYDVPGLRDSVRDEETGLVVEPDPHALCQAMRGISTDTELYERLASEGRSWSSSFTFDRSAQVVDRILCEMAA